MLHRMLSVTVPSGWLWDLHPMEVHFPVVLYVLAVGFELWSYVDRAATVAHRVSRWMLVLAMAATAVGIASGYLAQSLERWPAAMRPSLARMRLDAWITVAFASAALAYQCRFVQQKISWTNRLALTALLLGATTFCVLTTKAGSELVFDGWRHAAFPDVSSRYVIRSSLFTAAAVLGVSGLVGIAVVAAWRVRLRKRPTRLRRK